MKERLTITPRFHKRKDGWWISHIPGCEDVGPYDTKQEAQTAAAGLVRFYRDHYDSPPKKPLVKVNR